MRGLFSGSSSSLSPSLNAMYVHRSRGLLARLGRHRPSHQLRRPRLGSAPPSPQRGSCPWSLWVRTSRVGMIHSRVISSTEAGSFRWQAGPTENNRNPWGQNRTKYRILRSPRSDKRWSPPTQPPKMSLASGARPEPKPKVSELNGPVDVEKQCGVILPNGQACARSLTCKRHSMSAKRAVPGRSLPYDMLLAPYQEKLRALQQQKAAINASAHREVENDDGQTAVDSHQENDRDSRDEPETILPDL